MLTPRSTLQPTILMGKYSHFLVPCWDYFKCVLHCLSEGPQWFLTSVTCTVTMHYLLPCLPLFPVSIPPSLTGLLAIDPLKERPCSSIINIYINSSILPPKGLIAIYPYLSRAARYRMYDDTHNRRPKCHHDPINKVGA